MLSQEEINGIRSKADIVEIIGSYIPLVQKGRNYFAVCPFHDDHNPSMSISPEKQIYTCFVCGKSGNVFNFVMDYEKVSFIESLKIVANKIGITIDIDSVKEEKNEDNYYKIYNLAYKYYQNNINSKYGISAKEYLLKRGIDENIIKEFDIGLSINDNGLSILLDKKGFNNNSVLESFLVREGKDLFRNRIMFPLYDLDGKVVGFSGRIYNTDSDSKYINSSETKVFKKGKLLYNFHRAKEYARTKKNIIVVEGFMDVIRCHSIGIKNVVATMGTAITGDQARLLKRLSQNVILCFDGDKAGNKATISCIQELEKIGISPKIIRLPEKYDPDDYILNEGPESFTNFINNPLSSLDYKINEIRKEINFSDSIDVSRYINYALEEISKINDSVVKQIIIKRLSDETKLSITTIESMIKNNKVELPKKQIIKKKLTKYDIAEENIIYYMLNNIEIINYIIKNKPLFSTKEMRSLINEIICYYEKYKTFNLADFISYLEDKSDIISITLNIANKNIKENYTLNEIDDYLRVIENGGLKKDIGILQDKMKLETDENVKINLAMRIAELKKKESASNERN